VKLSPLVDAPPELTADEGLVLVKDRPASVRHYCVDDCKKGVGAEISSEGGDCDGVVAAGGDGLREDCIKGLQGRFQADVLVPKDTGDRKQLEILEPVLLVHFLRQQHIDPLDVLDSSQRDYRDDVDEDETAENATFFLHELVEGVMHADLADRLKSFRVFFVFNENEGDKILNAFCQLNATLCEQLF
jgi:hypothetical protein